MANRSTRSPEKEHALLAALELHPSKSRACRSARVPRRTFYEWLADDPTFKGRVEAAQERGIDAIEDRLFQMAASGKDTAATIFTMKTWRRERYGDATRHDHRHQHKHQHYDFSGFTPEQQARIDELAAEVEAGRIDS
jgi:hypothetical protein